MRANGQQEQGFHTGSALARRVWYGVGNGLSASLGLCLVNGESAPSGEMASKSGGLPPPLSAPFAPTLNRDLIQNACRFVRPNFGQPWPALDLCIFPAGNVT
jgi:hypothetical protein